MTEAVVRINEDRLLESALAAARDTKLLRIGEGVRRRAGGEFQSLFGAGPATVVADANTFAAAGRDAHAALVAAGIAVREPFLFEPDVYAEYSFFERLLERLAEQPSIPVAVGSGTINDLTKLAAHRLKRPYMVVATAASMDGYTAYGASITYQGSKQTFDCPAPLGVLADLEVIARAPAGMNASGYADLLAKNVAGADWILADTLGIEPIDAPVWTMVQGLLRSWVGSPGAVAANDPEALRSLVLGLMMSGFAMQALCSSRPASGADHQFSHLWDMQHHTYRGKMPSHGFKVGIGTLASLALHDYLLRKDLGCLDVERAVAAWPSFETLDARIETLFGQGALASKALLEMRAKYVEREALRRRLMRLRETWPELKQRLEQHLIPLDEAREKLRRAGCAFEPEQIGISRDRLRLSFRQAYYIRRRFTVLDLVEGAGLTDEALESLFGPRGRWRAEGGAA